MRKIFWFSLIAKLVVGALLPLTSDEAYYWVWSQFPQLSYYDHPPFVAWLYWLGSWINWYGGMVRWPGILLGHAALALWIKLLAPFLNERQRVYWLLLALLSPLVGGSGLLVTPDLPLMFFFALSLYLFFLWEKRPTVALSLVFGTAMGLGFSSKYMMVLFAFAVLPVILWSRPQRRNLIKNLHWLILGGLIGTLPVWLWNFMHDFASIKFQATHGLGRKIWKTSWTTEYVLLQIALIFPPILFWALRGRRHLPRVFQFLAWLPLGFFFFTTFRGYVEANWPLTAYPAIFALAVIHLPRNLKSLRITLGVWAGALLLAVCVLLARPEWSSRLKVREFHQFDAIVEKSRGLEPMFARSYQMAAKMHFEIGRPVFKIKGMNRKDFYDYLEQSRPVTDSFFVAVEKGDLLPAVYHQEGYELQETIPVDEKFEIRKMVKVAR